MYTKKWNIALLLFVSAMLQWNCGGCGGDKSEFIEYNEDASSFDGETTYDVQAMNEIIGSFSSPVEMAATIQNLGVPFSTKYLQDPEVVNDYTTSFKKALGLGMLCADLGYLNVYSKTSQIVDYLASIRKLSEDLNVGQFFDFQTLKRLATSNDNIDTLMIMCTQSYSDMENDLRKHQRSNLSALLVTGVWMESLYLITQVSKERPNDEHLKDVIGEQKTILNSLLPILKLYKNNQNFEKLVQLFEELKDVFDVVKITYEVGEPETKEMNGALVIVQNERSVITMTNEERQEIIQTTEKIRNKLIAL